MQSLSNFALSRYFQDWLAQLKNNIWTSIIFEDTVVCKHIFLDNIHGIWSNINLSPWQMHAIGQYGTVFTRLGFFCTMVLDKSASWSYQECDIYLIQQLKLDDIKMSWTTLHAIVYTNTVPKRHATKWKYKWRHIQWLLCDMINTGLGIGVHMWLACQIDMQRPFQVHNLLRLNSSHRSKIPCLKFVKYIYVQYMTLILKHIIDWKFHHYFPNIIW